MCAGEDQGRTKDNAIAADDPRTTSEDTQSAAARRAQARAERRRSRDGQATASGAQAGGRGAGERRRLARNAFGSYGARAVVGFSALALTPILYRKLGAAGFGTWSVIYTIATVFSLLEVGYAQGIAKFVAEYDAHDQDDEVRATIRAGVIAFAAIGLATAVGCLLLGVLGSGMAAPAARDAFRAGLAVLGLAVLIRFPLVAYGGGLQGYQRYDLFYLSDVVLGASFAVAAVIAVLLGGGVLALSACYGGALVGSASLYRVNIARVRRELGRGSLRLRSVRAHRGRRLAAFSGFTVLSESMTFVAQRMDTVIIAAVRDAAAAGPYAAAIKLQSGLQAMTTPFVNLMLPMASELQARGQNRLIAQRLTLATRVSLQMTLPVAAGLALFAEDVVKLWLGHNAPHSTFSIVVVLMAVQVVTLTAFPSQTVLVGLGRVRVIGLLAVLEGITNLGASIALVSVYGAIGAAIGSLCTSAVLAPVKFPLVCQALVWRLRRFLAESIVPAIVSSLPGLALMALARVAIGAGFAQAFVGLAAGLGVSLLIGVGQIGTNRIKGVAAELLAARNRPGVDTETQALAEAG